MYKRKRSIEEAEEHECPKNFEGCSKSMEVSSILKMIEDAFYNRFSIINVIVSEDDSTIRTVVKHPSKGVQGRIGLIVSVSVLGLLGETGFYALVGLLLDGWYGWTGLGVGGMGRDGGTDVSRRRNRSATIGF